MSLRIRHGAAIVYLVLAGGWNPPSHFLTFGVACCRAQVKGSDNIRQAVKEEVTRFQVGLGGFVQTQPYAGVDTKVLPAPVVAYEGEHLYVRSAIVGYRVITVNGLMIGPIVQPCLCGYSENDSPILNGMQDRHWSVDGGINLEAATDIGLFGISAVTDLLGRNRGQEVEWRYMAIFPVLPFFFAPSGGVRWKSDNLVNYYYGVKPGEARPGRPAYEGKQAFDPFLRLVIRYKLTQRWSLFTDTQYEWLASEITNSPIVNKNYQVSFAAGFLYAW